MEDKRGFCSPNGGGSAPSFNYFFWEIHGKSLHSLSFSCSIGNMEIVMQSNEIECPVLHTLLF